MGKMQSKYLVYLKFLGIPALFFALGYSGFFQSAAKFATLAFNKYVDAELIKLQSSSFYNGQGQAEYVIGLKETDLIVEHIGQLKKIRGIVEVENTSFSDWFVVSIEPGNTNAIELVKAADFVKFAYPNRGIWLCH